MAPDLITPIQEDYAERARLLLAAADIEPNAIIPSAPGTTPAWDDMCSQLYGRIVSIQPVVDANFRPGMPGGVRCGVHFWVVTLGLAVTYCVAVPGSDMKPPTPAQVAADGARLNLAAQQLQQAILCSPHTRTLVSGQPLPEQGGAAGFEWTFTVAVSVCPCED